MNGISFSSNISESFLGTYSNISLWPVVQDRADMSFVPNGYKQTSGEKYQMTVD